MRDFFGWFGTSRMFNWENVTAYKQYLVSKNIAAPTVNLRLTAVRKLAETAWLAKILPNEDYQRVQKVLGVKSSGVPLGNALTKEQAQRLLDAPLKIKKRLKSLRDRAIIAVMLGCGLRRDEIAILRIEHFATFKGTPCLKNIKGKGNKTRSVPMNAWCATLITRWIDVLPEHHRLPALPLFPVLHRNGSITPKHMGGQNIYNIITWYCEACGIINISPHALRRTFAQFAETGKAELKEIQFSLGHSDIKTTQRYLGGEQSFTESPAQAFQLDAGGTPQESSSDPAATAFASAISSTKSNT